MEEDERLLGRRSGSVGAVVEDGRDRFVRTDVEQQRTGAGGIDAFLAIALDQPENANCGAEALFRRRSRTQDDVDQRLGIGTDLGGFGTNTLMSPVAITTMRARHMLGSRKIAKQPLGFVVGRINIGDAGRIESAPGLSSAA